MADPFSEVGSQVVGKLFSNVVWLFVVLLIFAVIGILMWYFIIYQRKFDIKIKVTSNRADGNDQIMFDKGAFLTERKTGTPYLRIWKMKKDLPIPKYEIIQKTSDGDYIEIYRKSENEFYFLQPSTINKDVVIKNNGKEETLASQETKMVDPEMAFWAVKRKQLNKKMFDTESLAMKLIPFLPQILGGVFMIFILYILLDHLPGILAQLEKLYQANNALCRAELVTG